MFSVSTWRMVAKASWSSSTRELTIFRTFNTTNYFISVLASDDKLDQSTLD
jgi:hypothetical protein